MIMKILITTCRQQGQRRYMEDLTQIEWKKSKDGKCLEYLLCAVYDGHGGIHAAAHVKKHLFPELFAQEGIWSEDSEEVIKAIQNAFVLTHKKMWHIIGTASVFLYFVYFHTPTGPVHKREGDQRSWLDRLI